MSEEEIPCPLCLDDMDATDLAFHPCACGYQICLFCYHKLKDTDPKCPNCRREYDDSRCQFDIDAQQAWDDAKAKKKKEKRDRRTKVVPARKDLINVRVIQRNLVYVIGLAPKIAKEEVLRRHDYFGQYGSIVKIVTNRNHLAASNGRPASASAYVTFDDNEAARLAIQCVDGIVLEGRVIRASYGTTKYCNFFLRGQQCTNRDCLYLHELGQGDDSFTKEEMQSGKQLFLDLTHPDEESESPPVPEAPPLRTSYSTTVFPPPPVGDADGPPSLAPRSAPETPSVAPIAAPPASAAVGAPVPEPQPLKPQTSGAWKTWSVPVVVPEPVVSSSDFPSLDAVVAGPTPDGGATPTAAPAPTQSATGAASGSAGPATAVASRSLTPSSAPPAAAGGAAGAMEAIPRPSAASVARAANAPIGSPPPAAGKKPKKIRTKSTSSASSVPVPSGGTTPTPTGTNTTTTPEKPPRDPHSGASTTATASAPTSTTATVAAPSATTVGPIGSSSQTLTSSSLLGTGPLGGYSNMRSLLDPSPSDFGAVGDNMDTYASAATTPAIGIELQESESVMFMTRSDTPEDTPENTVSRSPMSTSVLGPPPGFMRPDMSPAQPVQRATFDPAPGLAIDPAISSWSMGTVGGGPRSTGGLFGQPSVWSSNTSQNSLWGAPSAPVGSGNGWGSAPGASPRPPPGLARQTPTYRGPPAVIDAEAARLGIASLLGVELGNDFASSSSMRSEPPLPAPPGLGFGPSPSMGSGLLGFGPTSPTASSGAPPGYGQPGYAAAAAAAAAAATSPTASSAPCTGGSGFPSDGRAWLQSIFPNVNVTFDTTPSSGSSNAGGSLMGSNMLWPSLSAERPPARPATSGPPPGLGGPPPSSGGPPPGLRSAASMGPLLGNSVWGAAPQPQPSLFSREVWGPPAAGSVPKDMPAEVQDPTIAWPSLSTATRAMPGMPPLAPAPAVTSASAPAPAAAPVPPASTAVPVDNARAPSADPDDNDGGDDDKSGRRRRRGRRK